MARHAAHLDEESFIAHWALGVALGIGGHFDDAAATLQAAVRMSSRHARGLSSLAVVLGKWGKRAEADALHRELLERSAAGYVPSAYLTLTADAAGLRDDAVAFARRAWDEREPPFILHARHFPEFRALRQDPRFAAILTEMTT
jgi:Flp pilus assembly protein TadD